VRVIVLGAGGREHALARALAADPNVSALHCAPGNAGTAGIADNHAINPVDGTAVTTLASRLHADLVVIGPEAPLVAGVADAVRDVGIACFGPSAAAATIEGSKAFAKHVMAAAGIPTADAQVCSTSDEIAAALDKFGPPYVVKDDGLAAGKGVVVTGDRTAAERHARACGRVVIEEFLDGPELSLFAISDGTDVVPLVPAQDFKRAYDGGTGPNTGGMGAYAPAMGHPPGHRPAAEPHPKLVDEVIETVIRPTIAEMRTRGTPYAGLLYAGLALTSAGIRVVEFNARFGDPETQVVLDRLRTPLGGLLRSAAVGDLAGEWGDGGSLDWAPGAAVTVVICAENYPAAPVKGDVIDGLATANTVPDAYVLHAGTAEPEPGHVVSAGGRVLNVVGSGADLAAARARAYEAVGHIRMRGMHYRTDIAAPCTEK
jgi:phosphoribosylamine--glycine ligase